MKLKLLWAIIIPVVVCIACERPSSPDFVTEQSSDIPLIKSVTYKLMGEGNGAIIDTTSENFEEMFSVDEDGHITLSSEIDFGLGNFDDIVPEIDVDPAEVETEIGLLDVDDFSSEFESEIGDIDNESEELDPEEAEIGVIEVAFDGVGSTDFEEVTGLPPVLIAGDQIQSPNEPVIVIIELDADEFQRAEVEDGALRFTFENNLGFDLSEMSATLLVNYDDVSGTGDAVGTRLDFQDVDHGDAVVDDINFDPGDEIIVDLALEVEIDWEDQLMSVDAVNGSLDVTGEDEQLEARNATANIREQTLDPNTDDLLISNPNFEYAIVSVDPEPGEEYQLIIEITNNTELPITNSLQSGMPGITIFNSQGDLLDGPKTFASTSGASELGENETAEVIIDLAGSRLTRQLSYDLDIGTVGGNGLTVDQDDFFLITSITTDLKFTEARSDIDPQSDIPLDDTSDVEGDFVDAEVETGSMFLEFTNESNMPLEINTLRFYNASEFVAKNTGRYFAEGSDIGEVNNVIVPPQSSVTEEVPLEGVGISNRIAYDGTASSPGTDTPETIFASDLIITNLDGSVQLRSASSVLDPQDFSTSGEVEISKDDFLQTSDNHYVEISSGVLRIHDIVNEIDMDIDTLIISFPNIRMDRNGTGVYDPADSLWIEFTGDNRVLRSSESHNGQPDAEQSLENVRIYAPGNQVTYNVRAITENSRLAQGADTIRTVQSTDRFMASVDIDNLEIRTAFGEVQSRVELLNDDEGDDGILDLFNDQEAEITSVEDLETLAERISGLQLYNTSFDLIYDTNLGVTGTLIAAIAGINNDGEMVFLSGKPGSGMEVQPDAEYQNLYANGAQIDRSDLITFDIEPTDQMGEIARSRVIRFDGGSSNVDEFLSNLPTEIRFVGKVVVNPDSDEGFIVEPVEFNTSMGIDIPINLSTAEGEPALIEDTVSVDLSELPNQEDDLQLSELTLFITYDNGLPFDTEFNLQFLDDLEEVITTSQGVPLESVNFSLDAARVDQVSRFVSQPQSGVAEIRLTGEMLDYIYRTRKLRLDGALATSRDDVSGEVKLRSDDFIRLSISANIKTTYRVSN